MAERLVLILPIVQRTKKNSQLSHTSFFMYYAIVYIEIHCVNIM